MKFLSLACLLAALTAFAADDAVVEKKSHSPEEIAAQKARIYEMVMRRTGGKVVKPGSQKGAIVYVNCQKRAAASWLEESARYFEKEAKFHTEVREGTFDLAAPKPVGNLSIFVVDDEALPSLLVAPESRWAMVNVAPLAKEAKPVFFEARVKKQLTRAFAYLCGGANSQYPMALTGGVTKPDDLDRFFDPKLPVDVIARFTSYLAPFGVTPAEIQTYRNACRQGWAPAPTNDYQKAIYERMQADKERGPSKPLTIAPPAKK